MAAYLINMYDETRRGSDSSREEDASLVSAVPQSVLSHFAIARTPQPSVESMSCHPKPVPDTVERPPTPITGSAVPDEYLQPEVEEGDYIVGCQCEFCEEFAEPVPDTVERPPTPITGTAVPDEYLQPEVEEGDYIVGCQCEFCEEFAAEMENQFPPTPCESPGLPMDEHNAVVTTEESYVTCDHDGSDTEVYEPDQMEMSNAYQDGGHDHVEEEYEMRVEANGTDVYEARHSGLVPTSATHNNVTGPIGALAEAGVVCEFTAATCNVNHGKDPYFRKCVSHVFGRNKSCTRTIPEHVWLYFCRKHYQRAKYRVDNWILKQCEMIHSTLVKLQNWGGVASFKVTLRKREARRIRSRIAVDSENSSPSAEIVVAKTPGTGNKYKSKSGTEKRAPVNVASPVPGWLERRLGDHMSFDQVHELIERIDHFARMMKAKEGVRLTFPDIEILPQSTDEILAEVAEARRQASRARKTRTTRQTRVSKKKGRVTKLASHGPQA